MMKVLTLTTNAITAANVYYLDQDDDFRPFGYDTLLSYKKAIRLDSYERTVNCNVKTELGKKWTASSVHYLFFIPFLYTRKL